MSTSPPIPPELGQHEVVRRVRQAIRSADVPADASVVAAVSGGRDSMALMLALAGSVESIVIAHIHHHRRSESDAELELVREAAAHFGLTFECRHLDGDQSATSADLREARYAALIDIARSHDATLVATGHQAEDQLESVLLAMIRGAGVRGLVGMRMRRSLCDGIDLFRPMLEVSRGAAKDLCEHGGVRWCDDPTNVDPATPRGMLRSEVMPALESLRSGAAQRMSEATPLRQAAAEALDAAVIRPVDGQWSRAALAAISEGLRRASIHAASIALCGGSDSMSSECIRDASETIIDDRQHRRTFEFGGGVVCVVEACSVRLARADVEA